MPLWSAPILCGVGALIILIGIPLAQGWVAPNRWYGLRLPATFADREVWFAANARTGRDLVWLGVLLFIVALAPRLVLPAAPSPVRAIPFLAILIVGSILVTVRGVRFASRLLAQRRSEKTPSS